MTDLSSIQIEIKALAQEVRENRETLRDNHNDYIRGLNGVQERIERRLTKLEAQIVGDGGEDALMTRVRALETGALAMARQREIDNGRINMMDACIDRVEKQQAKWKNIIIGLGLAWVIIAGLLWYIFGVLVR